MIEFIALVSLSSTIRNNNNNNNSNLKCNTIMILCFVLIKCIEIFIFSNDTKVRLDSLL